jgi:hypothetical protein
MRRTFAFCFYASLIVAGSWILYGGLVERSKGFVLLVGAFLLIFGAYLIWIDFLEPSRSKK